MLCFWLNQIGIVHYQVLKLSESLCAIEIFTCYATSFDLLFLIFCTNFKIWAYTKYMSPYYGCTLKIFHNVLY